MSLLPHFSLVKNFLEMTSCLKDKINKTRTVELGVGGDMVEKSRPLAWSLAPIQAAGTADPGVLVPFAPDVL